MCTKHPYVANLYEGPAASCARSLGDPMPQESCKRSSWEAGQWLQCAGLGLRNTWVQSVPGCRQLPAAPAPEAPMSPMPHGDWAGGAGSSVLETSWEALSLLLLKGEKIPRSCVCAMGRSPQEQTPPSVGGCKGAGPAVLLAFRACREAAPPEGACRITAQGQQRQGARGPSCCGRGAAWVVKRTDGGK